MIHSTLSTSAICNLNVMICSIKIKLFFNTNTIQYRQLIFNTNAKKSVKDILKHLAVFHPPLYHLISINDLLSSDVNWGSSTQAHVYKNALNTTLKLVSVADHIKNFRPQVLVLTGAPWARPELVDFVYSLTNKISLMVCGNIVEVGTHSILQV